MYEDTSIFEHSKSEIVSIKGGLVDEIILQGSIIFNCFLLKCIVVFGQSVG